MKFYKFTDELTNEEAYFAKLVLAQGTRPKKKPPGFTWVKDREMEGLGIQIWYYCRNGDVTKPIARIREDTLIDY